MLLTQKILELPFDFVNTPFFVLERKMFLYKGIKIVDCTRSQSDVVIMCVSHSYFEMVLMYEYKTKIDHVY